MQRKYDDQENRIHFQMDRFYQQNGSWFYTTREGDEKGPFLNRQDANGDLVDFLMLKHQMEGFGV